MSNTRLATLSARVLLASSLAGRANTSGSNSGLYLYVGRSLPWTGSDSNVPTPNDARSNLVSTWDYMVAGKLVEGGASKLMASRYVWDGNTVFTPWDDSDAEIFSQNFYATVNATAQYHVYKCLDNSNGAVSTSPPTFSDTSPSDTFYQTGDGYVWKYMYSIDKSDWDAFATLDYIPVIPNSNVSGNAVSGTIDVILVEDGGALYDHYFDGQWNSSDIQVGGNTTLFAIGNTASGVNGFYTNCIITIVEGTGKGQYRGVTGYLVSGSQKEIQVNSAFTTTPDTSSLYSISPEVGIVSLQGKQSVNAVGRALINSASSNSVWGVEMLGRGVGYRGASATVKVNPFVVISNTADLRPIISPPGGHGFNVYEELGATSVGFSVTLSNTEGNTISSDNDFREIGLLQDPLWSNVVFNITNSGNTAGSNGTFLVGEELKGVRPLWVVGTGSINTTSNTLIGTGTDFLNVFCTGDLLLLQAGASFHFGNVVSVTNGTSLVMSTNGVFVNGSASIARLSQVGNGSILAVGSSTLQVGNVAGGRWANSLVTSMLLGVNSFAVGYVNTVAINGVVKGFSTFNQRTAYQGTLTSGVFVEDEGVFQVSGANGASNSAVGNFHSTDTLGGVTKIYLVGEAGVFTANGVITGANSGAVFTVSGKVPGDLVLDSGKVLYVEDFLPVSRANGQSEVLKIVLRF